MVMGELDVEELMDVLRSFGGGDLRARHLVTVHVEDDRLRLRPGRAGGAHDEIETALVCAHDLAQIGGGLSPRTFG